MDLGGNETPPQTGQEWAVQLYRRSASQGWDDLIAQTRVDDPSQKKKQNEKNDTRKNPRRQSRGSNNNSKKKKKKSHQTKKAKTGHTQRHELKTPQRTFFSAQPRKGAIVVQFF